MRKLGWALRVAALGMTVAALCAPVSIAVAEAVTPVAGVWKGPFIGSNFTFEFKQENGAWTGRYQSEKSNKWAQLRNVTVIDGTVRFKFESQPPSAFTLKVDKTGKTLNGSATFGEHAALPLTLTRAS